MPSSLQDFATTVGGGRARCLLCTVPIEVEREAAAGKAAGLTYRVIGKWLTAEGYGENVTKNRLERHFQLGHTRSDKDAQ